MKRSAVTIAFDAIQPWILTLHQRTPMTWQLSDVGLDTQLIVNDVLAAFAREGYELRKTQS